MRESRFENKVAVIFGGSSGIGRGVSHRLASLGATSIALSRREPQDKKESVWLKCDVNSEAEIKRAVGKIRDRFKRIDILVNAMGINFSRPIEEIGLLEWNTVLQTNLTGAFLTMREVVPMMKENRSGKIVNIASIAGRHRSIASGAHYVSSKAGLIGLTKQAAYELGKFNINVNAVCPSQTQTPMLDKTMTAEQKIRLTQNIPLQRLADISDQVEPVVFLCSSGSKYMTGAVIDVNGGLL
ncbi:SDR family NAD(P)-dependent oxidoreductase [Arenicellales bacterium IMCC58067]